MASLISSWGGSTDTVYATVDEADAYIGSSTIVGYKSDPTIWTILSTVAKGRALLAATRDIDGAALYVGERQFFNQTLEFPRLAPSISRWPWGTSVYTDVNTYNIYLSEQQRRVKSATIEQAYALVRDGERNEHIERQLFGIRSFSETIGPISESASYGGTILSLIPESMELLLPYIGTPELVRG